MLESQASETRGLKAAYEARGYKDRELQAELDRVDMEVEGFRRQIGWVEENNQSIAGLIGELQDELDAQRGEHKGIAGQHQALAEAMRGRLEDVEAKLERQRRLWREMSSVIVDTRGRLPLKDASVLQEDVQLPDRSCAVDLEAKYINK